MRKTHFVCDLYKQSEEVIKKYEDMAFLELSIAGVLPCCMNSHPRESRYKKKFERTACDMYESETQKHKRGKSDKFK